LATNIAKVYNDLNRPQLTLQVLASIPKTFVVSESPIDKANIDMHYLRTYIMLKQFDKAQPYYDTITSIANSNRVGDVTKDLIYKYAADYCIYTNQIAKARRYLIRTIPISLKYRSVNADVDDARLWYKVDSALGNYRSAFKHLLYYKTKTDSILSETRVRQLQVLGVEYETEMKEDSIKSKEKDIALLTQKNSLQQANLRQATLVKNVTIAGIILSFIIIGLLYRQYQHKQRTNQLITHKNGQLQHLLNEKEWLLKEIHHRVKNNLQIVMSLLNSQSAYIDNPYALTAIHDSQHRVHAMSLIHQKLYGSENLSSINMSVYVRELVTYLSDSFDTGQRIRFECHIEPLEMDVSQAVPLGLILNEAITNSIKYAFPDGRNGVVSISLSATTPGHYLLRISDNGMGMPSHADNRKSGSLGMSLMEGLSEDLNGSFSIENNRGTTINISFADDRTVKRPHTLTASLVSSN
jgi:two-component sensor histidine kinase